MSFCFNYRLKRSFLMDSTEVSTFDFTSALSRKVSYCQIHPARSHMWVLSFSVCRTGSQARILRKRSVGMRIITTLLISSGRSITSLRASTCSAFRHVLHDLICRNKSEMNQGRVSDDIDAPLTPHCCSDLDFPVDEPLT